MFVQLLDGERRQALQQSLIATTTDRTGDTQDFALGGGQARQAMDHQVGDVVGIAVLRHRRQ
ncbi:hypothetical protein D3C76_548540 [compost metagenome]